MTEYGDYSPKEQLQLTVCQRLIAESLPHAKQIIFSKSGHTPLLTEPLKFSRELGIFLKENSQSSTSAA